MITLRFGQTEAGIDEQKGAVVSRFTFRQLLVLFPDGQLPTGGGMKRRGGIPLLFPCAGPLPADSRFPLPQHGFARDMAWQVIEKGEATVRLRLESDNQTLAMFPFAFALTLSLRLEEGLLRYDLEIENRSDQPMPTAPGLHPYIYIPAQNRANIITSVAEFDPAAYRDLETLSYAFHSPLTVHIPGHGEASMTASSQFKRLMIWSEPERDYICFEPWRGEVGSILSADGALVIPARSRESLALTISFKPEI
ncbi:hypothetical protein KGQ71_01740 [Patescibacteria group bacterium]|nr:hypothetical protein [Patescibacteria group bacterium]